MIWIRVRFTEYGVCLGTDANQAGLDLQFAADEGSRTLPTIPTYLWFFGFGHSTDETHGSATGIVPAMACARTATECP